MKQLIRWSRDWRLIRDILSFFIGGAGLITEMVRGFRNPTVALICAALMGVPAFFQPSKDKNGDNGGTQKKNSYNDS